MSKISKPPLHVAVGVIKNTDGKILIALRHASAHQGGLWEFSGGKVEKGESVQQALQRELKEELDIFDLTLQPLIKINHCYPDLEVLLDVWRVESFSGKARGAEGQEIKWVKIEQLSHYCFPAASQAIITAITLPTEYAILNDTEETRLLNNLNKLLNNGIKLIQARIKFLSAEAVQRFFDLAIPLCKAKNALLMVNSAVTGIDKLDGVGLHLTARDLLALQHKPTGYTWVAASCHNQQELHYAEKIGIDFIVLAPVLATPTHPHAKPLGWLKFKELVANSQLPVYALGGMKKADIYFAQCAGAQGIAGITAFLENT